MWYTEHDLRMIASPDLFVEVAAMKSDNGEDNLSSSLILD